MQVNLFGIYGPKTLGRVANFLDQFCLISRSPNQSSVEGMNGVPST